MAATLPLPAAMARTLRVLARLLAYPNADLRDHLNELQRAVHGEAALSPTRLAELDALIGSLSVAPAQALELESAYVELFDQGRSTSLHLFEHVHGDSRDRGPAMVDLIKTYEEAGLHLAPEELPDYLPVVLEYASTQPPKAARAFLAETAHILNAIHAALAQRRSRYAGVLAAVLELAGEKATPVKVAPDEPLDKTWAEPEVFDGCSSRGQAKPEQAQPIHIVRKASPSTAGAPTP